MTTAINLQNPCAFESSLEELSISKFPIKSFLTTWFVISSTLPMWKGKKNITITYSPIEGQPSWVFDDLVAYHASLSAAPTSPRKTIRGIDRPHRSSSKSTNQVRWKWRGKGFLRIISSHWQPLGYSFKSNSDPETDHQVLPEETDWVITYFSKTLFTPAGIDIYSRTGTGLPNDVKAQLVEAVRQSPVPSISKLADQLFDITHDQAVN